MTLITFLPANLLRFILYSLLMTSSYVGLSKGISTATSVLFSTVAIPFFAAAVVMLDYDLRIRNESYDLELRLAEMEAQVARKAEWERAAVDAGAGRAG